MAGMQDPPLDKAEQRLVPHHRQLPLLSLGTHEVVHQSINLRRRKGRCAVMRPGPRHQALWEAAGTAPASSLHRQCRHCLQYRLRPKALGMC